jgi:hypothetical protein
MLLPIENRLRSCCKLIKNDTLFITTLHGIWNGREIYLKEVLNMKQLQEVMGTLRLEG